MNADVYHVTGDINYFVPLLPRGRTVLTVHDIGHYLFGLAGIKRQIYKWLWLTWPIRIADVATCISEETKKNICIYLKFPTDHFAVIQNCYSPLFQPVAKAFNSTCPTILQVGTKSYKNVPRLVRALKGIHCRLVLIGKIDNELAKVLAESGTDYVNRVNLTHEELVQEYVACDIVSFVSIGEGFGVPILEAQAVGRPLLTSDVSPLRDVAGSGAYLADPLSEDSIRNGISRLIEDESCRVDLVAKGLLNAERYSAASTAECYLALYRSLSAKDRKKGKTLDIGRV